MLSISSILFPDGKSLFVCEPIISKNLSLIGDPGVGTPSILKFPSYWTCLFGV